MKVGENGVEMLQDVAMGCNKASQIPQSKTGHGKTKSDYTYSSDDHTSLMSPFVSESNV